MFNRIAVGLAGLALLAGTTLAAAPAFAASNPNPDTVNVSETVSQTVSISGLTDITFPATGAGNTATAHETYTVATDGSGYTLTETAGANSFNGPGSLPNAGNWSIQYSGAATGTYSPSTTARTVNTTSVPTNGDNYSENWSLAIPAGTTPGTYTNTLTYVATGH